MHTVSRPRELRDDEHELAPVAATIREDIGDFAPALRFHLDLLAGCIDVTPLAAELGAEIDRVMGRLEQLAETLKGCSD